MTPRLRKTIDWTVGLGLIAIGVVGGFLPIFQGWVFVVAGLAVLSSHSPLAKRLHDRFKRSVKKVRAKLTGAELDDEPSPPTDVRGGPGGGARPGPRAGSGRSHPEGTSDPSAE